MGFFRHAFCPAGRFWAWDPRGWRCSNCRYLVRADQRDLAWLRLARYHTDDIRIVPPAGPRPSEMTSTGDQEDEIDWSEPFETK